MRDEDRAARFRIIAERLSMDPKRAVGLAWLNAYKLDVRFLLGEIDQQAATNDGEDAQATEGAGS